MRPLAPVASLAFAVAAAACGLGGEYVLGTLPGNDLVGAGNTGDDPTGDPTSTSDTSSDDTNSDTGETNGDTGETGDDTFGFNLAFVTSQSFVGAEFGGLAGADAHCQSAAEAAGLPGAYRAWLSDNDTDARERFTQARGWVRTDGAPVANDLALFPADVFYPPDLDEYGRRVVGAWVWSGTGRTGARQDPWDTKICGAWTQAGTVTFGLSGAVSWLWSTSEYGIGCSTTARLHCFGVDHVATVQPIPVPGRRVFISEAELAADAGRDTADATCQAEAEAAGLSGEFLALMAAPGESASERFDLYGPQWVRMDGLPLFEANAPMTDPMAIGVGLNARGEAVQTHHRAWLGARTPFDVGTEDGTCQGWTLVDTAGQSWLASGLAADWLGWTGYYQSTAECNEAYRLLCFER